MDFSTPKHDQDIGSEPPMPTNPHAFLTKPHACNDTCVCTAKQQHRLRTRRNALCDLCRLAFRDSRQHICSLHHRRSVQTLLNGMLEDTAAQWQIDAFTAVFAAFTRFSSVLCWLRRMVRKLRGLFSSPLVADRDSRLVLLRYLASKFRRLGAFWARQDQNCVRDARMQELAASASNGGSIPRGMPQRFVKARPQVSRRNEGNCISDAFDLLGSDALPGPLAPEEDICWDDSETNDEDVGNDDGDLRGDDDRDFQAEKGSRNAAMIAKYGRGMAGYRNGKWEYVPGREEVAEPGVTGSETDVEGAEGIGEEDHADLETSDEEDESSAMDSSVADV